MWFKLALNFLGSRLLSPLGSLLDRLGYWIGQHKELVAFVLLATTCLFGYTTFRANQALRQTRHVLELTRTENDSLQRITAHLVFDRNSAYQYADSLSKRSYALKDSIRDVVAAMPADTRTKLNRQLLSELGFTK